MSPDPSAPAIVVYIADCVGRCQVLHDHAEEFARLCLVAGVSAAVLALFLLAIVAVTIAYRKFA